MFQFNYQPTLIKQVHTYGHFLYFFWGIFQKITLNLKLVVY